MPWVWKHMSSPTRGILEELLAQAQTEEAAAAQKLRNTPVRAREYPLIADEWDAASRRLVALAKCLTLI